MVKFCVVVSAVAVSAVTVANPRLAERLGLDVWNLPGLRAKIEASEERDREIAAEGDDLQHRIALKEAIVADVLADRSDLATATERFLEMNRTRPEYMNVIRAAHPGDTDEEKMAHNVIAFCQTRVPPADRATLTERLGAQLARMRSVP